MAKILDIPVVKKFAGNAYRIIPHSDEYTSLLICRRAVREVLNIVPNYIRIRIYTKNPKRKNQIHVKRVFNYNRYKWRGTETDAYHYMNFVVKGYNEFWIVIEEITEKEAEKMQNRGKN